MIQNKKEHKTSIGGQALIEGIMMRGPQKSSMAVRLASGEIDVETWDTYKKNSKLNTVKKIPFIRGIFNMLDSLILGYKCLMKSADKVEIEEEDSKFEKWLNDKLGDNMMNVVSVIALVLGMGISVVLFLFVPSLAVWGLEFLFPVGIFKGAIEGIIKIIIFVLYLWLVSKNPDIKRVFGYHGAEHKTIACYEAGEELTVENIRKKSRFHPRCGTSFLILVLIIGIIIFSVVTWSDPITRTLIKIALMPIVVGVAYELIKIAGKYDNVVTRAVSYPGTKLQHLTTVEPDDKQIEVAIKAMEVVIPENKEEDKW